MNDTIHAVPRTGRGALWLGLACLVLGIALYPVHLLALHRTDIPWHVPAILTLGAVLVLLSLSRRTTVWRALAFVLTGALAGFMWWFLLIHARLPAYTGPLTADQPFPTFAAVQADGTPFTQANLTGEKDSVLIFFRGRW